MLEYDHRPPAGTALGKAKALEATVLQDGSRLFKKVKVRFWIERMGAREEFYIIHNEKTYHLGALEFKRRFKVIIKCGIVRLKPPQEEPV